MEKLSEIEILIVNGKKQYMCTSEIWEIADKVNEIVDYINKKESNSDKDHRIAVLERALRNCCEHLLNTTDIITKPFSEDYADESRIKEKIQIYINEAEKELEEKEE